MDDHCTRTSSKIQEAPASRMRSSRAYQGCQTCLSNQNPISWSVAFDQAVIRHESVEGKKDLIWKRDVSEVTGYGGFFSSKHAHGPNWRIATGS
jgi:hypothetical protein